MERFVFSLYGFWFWLTRKYRGARYGEAADSLRAARIYLLNDFGTRASTRDRGSMLPHQVEALRLLERHSALTMQTSRRFASLSECCRFIAEELAEPQPALVVSQPASPVPAPAGSFFAPIAVRVTGMLTAGSRSLSFLQPLWSSERAGSIGDLRRVRWGLLAAVAGSANPLSRLSENSAKAQVQ